MFRRVDNDEELIPGVLPVLSLGTRYLDVNVTYVPKFTHDTVPLFFFQAVVPLGRL